MSRPIAVLLRVPLVVAMVLAVLATALVLRPGDGLRLSRGTAAGAVAAVAGLCAAMTLTVPQPALGILVWHLFSVQLVLVTLVVRRRAGWALLGLAQSLRMEDRGVEADAVHERFQQAFARADVTPPASRY